MTTGETGCLTQQIECCRLHVFVIGEDLMERAGVAGLVSDEVIGGLEINTMGDEGQLFTRI